MTNIKKHKLELKVVRYTSFTQLIICVSVVSFILTAGSFAITSFVYALVACLTIILAFTIIEYFNYQTFVASVKRSAIDRMRNLSKDEISSVQFASTPLVVSLVDVFLDSLNSNNLNNIFSDHEVFALCLLFTERIKALYSITGDNILELFADFLYWKVLHALKEGVVEKNNIHPIIELMTNHPIESRVFDKQKYYYWKSNK